MTLEAHEIPTVTEDMTPDAAKGVLDKIYDAAAVDPSHAYTNAHHPLHRKWTDAMAALHGVYAKREGAGVTPTTQACLAAMDEQAGRDAAQQEELRAAGQTELNKLQALGFEAVALPDELPAWQVETWRMQRLAAEGDHATLAPMLAKQLKALGESAQIMDLFQQFSTAENIDANLRSQITEQLIGWIHTANKQKFGRGK